ncbi:MAG TPA: SUF system NifU family Fe-S cluster assembly protein [Candidatus Deferrimicrobium sp.]|nr:SUF system NifU family Fe-S cluster assembly protein [Candidatus Deferrimicrobium sp.]
MSGALDDMYRDIIMDHYRSPRGRKPLERADVTSDGSNPSCGDEIQLEVELNDDTVKDVHVDCRGCAISVASGSMLAEVIKGKSLAEARRIAEHVRKMLRGESIEMADDLSDLTALQGVRNFPVRVKCALLAWITLMEGIKSHENGRSATPHASTEDNE